MGAVTMVPANLRPNMQKVIVTAQMISRPRIGVTFIRIYVPDNQISHNEVSFFKLFKRIGDEDNV